ncbi:hypothetical protein T492DRAFT_295373, partial [Pavlovales sp. CCMP2436]
RNNNTAHKLVGAPEAPIGWRESDLDRAQRVAPAGFWHPPPPVRLSAAPQGGIELCRPCCDELVKLGASNRVFTQSVVNEVLAVARVEEEEIRLLEQVQVELVTRACKALNEGVQPALVGDQEQVAEGTGPVDELVKVLVNLAHLRADLIVRLFG